MFNLPRATEVNKIIPKNAFDAYINTKQKRAIAEKILRVRWMNKLSIDTINLQGKEIEEIQIFEIELKEQTYIKDILNIINKAIPYTIIFVVRYRDLFYFSTSVKHINPKKENISVVDYTFVTAWKKKEDTNFIIELKNNLDWVYKNFCEQFNIQSIKTSNLVELIKFHGDNDMLRREIEKLEAAILKCKQFSKKVDLNLKLKELKKELLQ